MVWITIFLFASHFLPLFEILKPYRENNLSGKSDRTNTEQISGLIRFLKLLEAR